MNFNHLLSGAAGRGDFTKTGDMASQALVLRLGQKRTNDHLNDHNTCSEVITRRKLETDPKIPSRPLPNRIHLSYPSPWTNPSSSSPRFTQMTRFGLTTELGLGGATTDQFPLNHSAGALSLPKYSMSVKFAEMEARASSSILESKRFADNLTSKELLPSGYDSEYTRQQMFSVYTRGLESMRLALGKDVSRSSEDKAQNEATKFTMNGEPVDNSTEPVLTEGFQEMHRSEPHPVTNRRGLYSLSPYFYENGSLGSNSALSRGFYRSSLSDQFGNGLLGGNILSDPSANFHSSVDLKIGRGTPGSSNLLSFEAAKSSMQEAMHNIGRSPAEAGTSKSVLKSVTLRKKDRDNSNVFPANVKSLLSTGIFDGVPVKYVSWDRTKNVRGTIQGTGYLCWCKDCKKTKMVNAYQLEQHAGSKSKHPNDHIYFSNGNSIYGVVQELKNTPSDKLLEVIPTVTGSGINNENFSKWKESFQAAGRELQRIFGSDLEQGEASSSKNAVVSEDGELDRSLHEQIDASSSVAV